MCRKFRCGPSNSWLHGIRSDSIEFDLMRPEDSSSRLKISPDITEFTFEKWFFVRPTLTQKITTISVRMLKVWTTENPIMSTQKQLQTTRHLVYCILLDVAMKLGRLEEYEHLNLVRFTTQFVYLDVYSRLGSGSVVSSFFLDCIQMIFGRKL